ncbi:MAG: ATP-binding cassette domain-containing protein [Chloroflexi bacterium]|nr:ATP-binding cassette domain-containing protein [Chloroflexota bacterium]
MQSDDSSNNAIVVEGLGKSFGDVTAIEDISFEVPRGTVLGLLGPNGAGKTTTVRILTTLIKATRGHASVLGIDVSQNPQAVRERIGLAGQYAAVDENLTGRENLRLIARLTHQPKNTIEGRVGEMLERFDLVAAADRPSRTYSGGMRRRLDLAAALVHRPPVLFLDEPTTGLDPSSRSDLWDIIGELVRDGTTVLVTTHYLDEADRLSDNIIVIDHGNIVAQGTADELKSRLGAVVIELTLADQAQAGRARDALAAIGPSEIDTHGKSLELKVTNGTQALMDVVRILDKENITPVDLGVRESTLDDVFLSLTGRKAGETNGTPESSPIAGEKA